MSTAVTRAPRRATSSCGTPGFEQVVIAQPRATGPFEQSALHARQPPSHARCALEPARGVARRQHDAEWPRDIEDEKWLEEARAFARRGVVDSQSAPLAPSAAQPAKRPAGVTAQQVPTH